MVARFHDAGIEVILDVVYNHTAEGNHLGPTLSFKGIDNASYYRLLPDQPRYYINDTGTGNTFNLSHPARAADGDRLAALLGAGDARRRIPLRPWHHPGPRDARLRRRRRLSQFLPAGSRAVVGQADRRAVGCGPGGYQVGALSPGWAEWNDRLSRYGEIVLERRRRQGRRFRGAYCGSADLFNRRGRKPWASVNFITAHDGFTLNDLVSYDEQAQ